MLYPIFREKSTPQHPVGHVGIRSAASVSGASRLVKLPNELLVQIWTYMSRKDIESLSLVNRHIHNLGRQYIQEHRRLKQRYQIVQNPLPYGHEPRVAKVSPKKLIGHSLIKIFTELYGTPSAQSYVEEIIINDCMAIWDTRKAHRKEERARQKDTQNSFHLAKSHISSLITKHEGLNLDCMGRDWEPDRSMAKVLEGDENCLLALLLTLTPEVQTIHLRSFPEQRHAILHIVGAIAGIETSARAEAIARDEPNPFLTRLSKVVFDGRDIVADFDMSALLAFAVLPSLREIHADNVSEEDMSWYGADRNFIGYESNVTDIILTSANIFFHSLYQLLLLCKRLQKFVYEPCDWGDCRNYGGLICYRFEPRQIREVLFDSTRHSLNYLKIHCRGREHSYMGSLKDFKVLSVLHTDWSLLRDHTRPARQMLTDTLPAAIEEVRLVSAIGSTMDMSVNALHHLIASKRQHFPVLKIIHLTNTSLLQFIEVKLVANGLENGIKVTFDRSVSPEMGIDESDEEEEKEDDFQWYEKEDVSDDEWGWPLERYFHYPEY